MDPASDWCQRWNGRRHSWRHRSDGGFDQGRYEISGQLSGADAKAFVCTNHYSASYPAAVHRFGLYDTDRAAMDAAGTDTPRLVGVAVLGVPVQAKVLTNVFPDLECFRESLELSRFVLLDDCPGNTESYFLGGVWRLAAERDVRGVVSFSDPMPRTTGDGTVICGHVGTIYQATNAQYCGRATPRTLRVLPDGTVLNDRALAKVTAQDQGHDYVEARLVAHGARAPRAGADMRAWLKDALDDAGVRRVRHRGNFRYAFTIGSRSQRRATRIALPAQPYPKHADAA